MEFDYPGWISDIIEKIRRQFGKRVWLIGLQGSCRRGEATPQSDIDIVVIFESLATEDLSAYREIVNRMPCPEKACGFVSGKAELFSWPKSDLFQFCHDTLPLYGSLGEIEALIGEEDIRDAVRLQSANLYHAACHSYLFEDCRANISSLLKSAFFLLQAKTFLETGVYYDKKESLLAHAGPEDAAIFSFFEQEPSPEERCQRLIGWAGNILCRTAV